MSKLLVNGEMILHGTIGQDWFGDGIVAADVIQALAEVGRSADITVRINSGGGIATEGAAIYAALRNHQGDVNVVVEGIAASAATIIAMAGDKIAMSLGSVMMIHDPAGLTMGTAADHQKSQDALNTIADAMAGVYAERTGKTAKAERQVMTNETWMTAEEAVAQGYADALAGAAEDGAPIMPTAFNYALYARAPQHLVAMAKAKGWARAASIDPSAIMPAPTKPRGADAAPQTAKESAMTTKTPAEIAAEAEAARLAAEATTAATAKAAADKLAADHAVAITTAATEATAAANKRSADINALCQLAGQPATKANEYIASAKSLDEIRTELTALKAGTGGKDVNTHHRGAEDPTAQLWAGAIAQVNKEQGRAAR